MAAQHGREREKRPPRTLSFLQTLIVILAIGLGVTVAVGLRGVLAEDGGFTSWLVPIVFAAILSTLLAGLWHVTLRMVSRINPHDAKEVWTAIGYALALTAAHAATSMPFLASAIGGRDAIRHHQDQSINALIVAADTIAATRDAQARLQRGVSRQHERLRQLLELEVAGAGPSRQEGFGPVARSIQEAADILTGASRSIESHAGLFDAELVAARSAIEAARQASLAGDKERFSEHFAAARSLLATLAGKVRPHAEFGYDFSGSPLSDIRDVGVDLGLLVQQLGMGAPRIVLPVYEPISRPVAVLTYAEAVPLAWSVAIAADALPLAVIVLLILFRQTDGRARPRFKAPSHRAL